MELVKLALEKSLKKSNIVLLILCVLPLLSYADTSRFYGGLGVGKADYKGKSRGSRNDIIGIWLDQRPKDKIDFGELYFGYHYNDHVSFEIGYADFNDVQERYKLRPGVALIMAIPDGAEVDIKRISLNTMIEYPAWKNLRVFGLIGYSYFDLYRKLSDYFSGPRYKNPGADYQEGLMYGLGIKYLFNDRYSARFQWTDSQTSDLDVSATRLSIEINF